MLRGLQLILKQNEGGSQTPDPDVSKVLQLNSSDHQTPEKR